MSAASRTVTSLEGECDDASALTAGAMLPNLETLNLGKLKASRPAGRQSRR